MYLKIPNYELKPLFSLLAGDLALDSPRILTREARVALKRVEQGLQDVVLFRCKEGEKIALCILSTFLQPTGLPAMAGRSPVVGAS